MDAPCYQLHLEALMRRTDDMPIHTQQELQRMFEEFGLGTEESRRRFRALAGEQKCGTEPLKKGFAFRLDNSSSGTCLAGGEEHAELASDPR